MMVGRITILRTSGVVGILSSLSATIISVLQAVPLIDKVIENGESWYKSFVVKPWRKMNNMISLVV